MLEVFGETVDRDRNEMTAETLATGPQGPTSEVAELVQAIQERSSPQDFQPLFERYYAPVTHFFLNRRFSRHASEDLAQDALLRVYRNIGAFRSDSSFDTWLFRIVENVWKNELRRLGAEKRQGNEVPVDAISGDDSGEVAMPGVEDPLEGPLDLALADERQRVLIQALGELPPKMRQVVLLRFFQDRKYQEIAALMKVSIATVKTQLNLAKKRLGPLLEPHSDMLT